MIETMNYPFLAFINSPSQLMVIAVLVLILFGAKKLPGFARSLGRSMGEFRRAKEEFEQELHSAVEETVKQPEKRIEPPKMAEASVERHETVGSAKAG